MYVVLSDQSNLGKADWLQAMPKKDNAETQSTQGTQYTTCSREILHNCPQICTMVRTEFD
jgi:hypothetical protein